MAELGLKITPDLRVKMDWGVLKSGPEGTEVLQLHTGDMRPVRHGDLTIALVELQPYPFSARPTEPAEYRATFHVTR